MSISRSSIQSLLFVGLGAIVFVVVLISDLEFTSQVFFSKTTELPVYHHYNESTVYKIPKVCYQTWVTKDHTKLTNITLEVLAENKRLNPDIDFQLWDDNDVIDFIKREFPGEVYESFITINPKYGAARADFFRYCVLYKYGGLYMDIKSHFRIKNIFGDIIQPEDECVLDLRKGLETYRLLWNYWTYEQWVLAFAPGHPYLRRMIERMVRSIKEKVATPVAPTDEGPAWAAKYQVMRVTGPDALAVAIHDAVIDYGVRHREVDYRKWVKYSKVGKNPEYANLHVAHYNEVKDSFYVKSSPRKGRRLRNWKNNNDDNSITRD